MIKYFRKIRQNLLAEGKTGKYLKYAVGEIVLVLIGILLALQVNNWNINQNNLKESREFVNRLQKEIISNINFTKSEIQRKEREIKSALAILKMIDEEDKTKNSSRSLDSLIFISMTNNNMEFKIGTLNEGFNTGKVALITSDSLKSLLYGLPSIIDETRVLEKYNNEDLNSYFYPFIYKNISFRQMDGVHSEYADQIGTSKFTNHKNLNVLNSMEFESLIDNRFYSCNSQLKSYVNLKNYLDSINKMIEEFH
jgi:hypothetical protein